MGDDLPAGFYEHVDRKNWTVDIIQRGLCINDDLYTTIYTTMEAEMSLHNLLGNKLNQTNVKKKLHIISANIQQRFPTTFENIPDAWREKCLFAIAQKCNFNARRRATRSGSPCCLTDSGGRDAAGSLPMQSEPEGKQLSTRPRVLDTITVLISMVEGGQSTICRVRDFIGGESSDSITVESLAFDQFITVLQEDIQFDTAKHSISYSCTKDITVPIANERSWKAAIGDMYIGGLDRFVFHVEEKGE
jgi:hypothetical protein